MGVLLEARRGQVLYICVYKMSKYFEQGFSDIQDGCVKREIRTA